MPLSQVSLSTAIQWAFDVTQPPFADLVQGPDGQSFSLTGINVATFNELYAEQLTITAGSNTDIDFSSFTDLTGASTGFTQILSLYILPVGVNAQCTLAVGASNGLVWFFGGTAPTISIPIGSHFCYSLPPGGSGQTVDSTHKIMNIANGGSGTLTVIVIAIGAH